MIINRYVTLNPLEPAPLSLRLAPGVPTTIKFVFQQVITGAPINYDLKAKIIFTARSSGQHLVYDVLSTDISNGKAAVTIPEATFIDPNGYRIRLFGNVKWPNEPAAESTLIAMGTARLFVGQYMTTPEGIPVP